VPPVGYPRSFFTFLHRNDDDDDGDEEEEEENSSRIF
jgi:hypothetical protein